MSKRNIWIVGLIAIAVIAGFSLLPESDSSDTNNSEVSLKPVDSFKDVHGMAVDAKDPNKVYIATHNGLFLMKNDKDLFQVGAKADDYMGFSAHPTDANTFFTGGHNAAMTANLGVQKTTDGGKTWEKLGNGVGSRPADFHTMAVSQADPTIIYGSAMGQLQRSQDGGKTWVVLSAPGQVITLATDTIDKNIVYTGTDKGLYVSKDQGNTWNSSSTALNGSAVTTLAVNPADNKTILSFSQSSGLAKSSDQGTSWTPLQTEFASDGIAYIAYSKPTPGTIYAVTRTLNIYKSTDDGATWNKVR